MRMRAMVFAVLVGVLFAGLPTPPAEARHRYDMYFPLAGDGYYYYRSFGACRDNCRRKHQGIDIMAPKLTPVIAVADGTVRYVGEEDECCAVSLRHDDGWHSVYAHLNNDRPGTDNGKLTGYAPGIALGVHVTAGTLLGWVGDSGNAEHTTPHLHFEIRRPSGEKGRPIDPWPSLRASELLDRPLQRPTSVCDFNGDGLRDWAMGNPMADKDTVADSGTVTVFYGSTTGPLNALTTDWLEKARRLVGHAELDLFGSALACGDFNGDGYEDLAVGAPGVDQQRARHAGAVFVYPGSADGLVAANAERLNPDRPYNDRFGSALGAADLNGDEMCDLVVGAPYTATRRSRNGGAVILYRGTTAGLLYPEIIESPQPSSRWHLIRFGTSIHIEDRNGDTIPDVVVGAAGTEEGDPGGAAYFVIPSSELPEVPNEVG